MFARNLLFTRRWKLWSVEWGARIIYSHGTTHSKGVCILLNPSSPLNLSSIQVDPEGRFLIAKLTIEEKYFLITNIYGPNNCHDQDGFIKTLSQQLMSKTDISKVIISGNCMHLMRALRLCSIMISYLVSFHVYN